MSMLMGALGGGGTNVSSSAAARTSSSGYQQAGSGVNSPFIVDYSTGGGDAGLLSAALKYPFTNVTSPQTLGQYSTGGSLSKMLPWIIGGGAALVVVMLIKRKK